MTESDPRPVILLVFANDGRPGGAWLRKLGEEQREIQAAFRGLVRSDRCTVVPLTSATHTTLLNGISDYRDRIVGVHFGGHAHPGGLQLQDESGTPSPLRIAGLTQALAKAGRLRWIFLNGCGTEAHVEALHARLAVPIIATDRAILDTLARHFAARFYDALAGGESLSEAFATAGQEGPARYASAADALRADVTAEASDGGRLRLLEAAEAGAEAGEGWPWVMRLPAERPDAADWVLVERSGGRDGPQRPGRARIAAAAAAALAVAVGVWFFVRDPSPGGSATVDAAVTVIDHGAPSGGGPGHGSEHDAAASPVAGTCRWEQMFDIFRLDPRNQRTERFRPALASLGDDWAAWTVDFDGVPRLRRYALAPGVVSTDPSTLCSPQDRGHWWLCPRPESQVVLTYSPMKDGPPQIAETETAGAMSAFTQFTHEGHAMTALPDLDAPARSRVFYVDAQGAHLGAPRDPGQDRATIAFEGDVSLRDPVIAQQGDQYCLVAIEEGTGEERLTAFTVPVTTGRASPIARHHAMPGAPPCMRPALQRIEAGWLVVCDHRDEDVLAAYVSPDCRDWRRVSDLPAQAVALDGARQAPDAPVVGPGPEGGAVAAWPRADAVVIARFDGQGQMRETAVQRAPGRPLGVAIGTGPTESSPSARLATTDYLIAWSTAEDYEPRFARYGLVCDR